MAAERRPCREADMSMQRKDEDLTQIMTDEELREYRRLERDEQNADLLLWASRKKMRAMRAKARARQRRK